MQRPGGVYRSMDERDWLAERFQEHRPRLRAVAYRMLGSTSEADDAVQETWIRLSRSNAGEIDNLEAWLTTVVGRVALNMLRSRKTRREVPLETHLPDPIVDRADGIDPEHEALLADSVGLALLVVLETLTPAERLAYVLHDMFSVPFDEIGAMLDPDIVRREDTGSGTIVEDRGAENIARKAMAFAQLGLVVRPALINGAAGWVALRDGDVYAIAALTLHNGRITTMDVLLDPARLARLDLTVFDPRL